jgi:hypothetical protein
MYSQGTYCGVPNTTVFYSTGQYTNAYGEDGCHWTYEYFKLETRSQCPTGFNQQGSTCNDPAAPVPNPDDPTRGLDQFDGDPSGCDGAGGVYMVTGRCNTKSEAFNEILGNPLAALGFLVTIGGVSLSGLGLVSLPVTAGSSALAVSVGVHATVAGLGMMGISAMGDIAYNPQNIPPSNDMTVGETRIKINPTSSGGSGGTIPGSYVTQTNPNTGKTEASTFVPDTIVPQLSDSSNVDTSTGQPITPISLSGIESTIYDYETNTATTVRHLPDSTSSVPHTSTTTTSFTVTQNIDGSVTTVPTNTAVAPTVSGTDGGTVVSAPTAPVSSGSTGSGTTTGDGTDYTGVLNDIKNNTGSSASTLDSILSMFDDTPFDGTMNDGSDSFGDLKATAEGSFGGFVYTDPLGLNNSASSTIPTYSFTLMGQTFVIFDQELFNKLPVDLIKGILLMVAAIAGLITTISGV